jgi:PEP-CTERM motif
MKTSIRTRLNRLLAIAALGLAGSASAAPVAFDIRSYFFSPGDGYGSGNSRLDVDFDVDSERQQFSLNVGDSFTFTFGEVKLEEDDIADAERDGLNVSATFNFDNPLDANRTVNASGTATLGPVRDRPSELTDLVIDWTDLVVDFAGGQFLISMNDLTFTNSRDVEQKATIKLLSLTTPGGGGGDVPEPATLALVGGALLLVGAARRRRAS